MIERYDNKKHFKMLKNWLKFHDQHLETPELLGKTGFVVDNNAIGFLFKTDSLQCWIANVAGNPHISKEIRDRALNILISTLEDEAKKSGFKFITTMSHLPTMKNRFNKLGFSSLESVTAFFKHLGA